MSKLNIFSGEKFDTAIAREEIHTYHPVTKNHDNNDDIRIVIQHEDLYTSPFESFIYLSGSLVKRISVVNSHRSGLNCA